MKIKIKRKLRRKVDDLVESAAILEAQFDKTEQYHYFCEYIRLNEAMIVANMEVDAPTLQNETMAKFIDAILSIPSGFRSNDINLDDAETYMSDMNNLWKEWAKLLDQFDLTA